MFWFLQKGPTWRPASATWPGAMTASTTATSGARSTPWTSSSVTSRRKESWIPRCETYFVVLFSWFKMAHMAYWIALVLCAKVFINGAFWSVIYLLRMGWMTGALGKIKRLSFVRSGRERRVSEKHFGNICFKLTARMGNLDVKTAPA